MPDLAPQSAEQLARWLECDDARVAEFISRGMPRQPDGLFDRYQVAQWLEANGLGRRVELRGTVTTLAAVAQAFGVAVSTIKKEWKRNGMPGRAGCYDLAEIHRWKSLRSRDPAHDQAGGDGQANQRRRLAAEVRIKEAEAERRERENLEQNGAIVLREKADRGLAQCVIAARSAFINLPRKMQPRFPKAQSVELSEELKKEIDLILKDLSEWRPDYDRA